MPITAARYFKLFKYPVFFMSIIAFMLIFLAACSSNEEAVPEVTVPVEVGDLEVSVTFSGRITFPESAREVFLANGTVGAILVNEGDLVEVGDALARLSSSDIDVSETEIESNLATIDSRKAGISTAMANINTREAGIQDAQLNLDQAKEELDSSINGSIADMREDAKDVYIDVIERWLGITPSSEEAETDPDILLAALGIDLTALYDDRLTRSLIDSNGIDDPSTRWNETVVLTWRTLFPGIIESECDDEDSGRNQLGAPRCVKNEIDEAWDAVRPILDSVAEQEIRISEAENNLTSAMINLEAARIGLRAAMTELSVAERTLETSRDELQDTTLVASSAGLLTNVNMEVGDEVPDAQIFIDIENQDIVEMVGNLAELDVSLVKSGARAIVTINVFADRPLEGVIKRIGELSGTLFQATVSLPSIPEDLLIRPGLNASARIVAEQYTEVLLIPAIAVEGNRINPFVNIKISEEETVQRNIRTGASDGASVVVLEGLSEGELVVIPQATGSVALPDPEQAIIIEEGEEGVGGGR